MKKVILSIISCLALVSCTDVNPIKDGGLSGKVYVKEVTYKNHSYLEFKDNGIYGQGWVHNPDCECYIEKYD